MSKEKTLSRSDPFTVAVHEPKSRDERFNHGCTERILSAAGMGVTAGIITGLWSSAWDPDTLRLSGRMHNTFRSRTFLSLPYYVRHVTLPVALLATTGVLFAGTECLLEDVRGQRGDHADEHEHTWINAAVAGAVAGAFASSFARRIDVTVTTSLCVGAVMGLVEYNTAARTDPEVRTTERIQDEEEAGSVQPNSLLSSNLPTFNPLFVSSRWFVPPNMNESKAVQSLKKQYPEYKNV